jgi:sterol desaturase/sphingolipid hydroxylase (fatty acid hydroxylase superfamily)
MIQRIGYHARHASTLLVAYLGYQLPVTNLMLISSLWWITCSWVPVAIFQLLDTYCHYPKMLTRKTEVPFFHLCQVALCNQIVSLCVSNVFLSYYRDTSSMNEALWAISFLFLFDIVFYLGHWIMHAIPWIYRYIHKMHHQTFADTAISYHYMTIFDFLLEVTLPSLLPLAIIGIHPHVWMAFIGFGSWNGAAVHSGWDIPFLPNPTYHLIHHHQLHQNIDAGVLHFLFTFFSQIIRYVKSHVVVQDPLKI